MEAWIEAFEEGVDHSGRETLAPHGGALRWLARRWLENVRRNPDFLAPDGKDSLPALARRYLPENLFALVAGHTHGPRCHPAARPIYLNTGTWMPVGAVPAGDLEPLIDRLDAGLGWPAEAPRTFAWIDWTNGRPLLALGGCDADGTPRSR